MRFAALVLMMSLAVPANAEDPKPYTMEDLKALVEQETWPELLAHLNDVSPRERKGDWKKYLSQAAVGYIASIDAMKERYGAMMTGESFIVKYPMLKKDKIFMAKRAEVGFKAFEECFQARYGVSECKERLMAFVKLDPKNSDLGFKAAKLVRLKMNHSAAATLFNNAVTKKTAATHCKDADLHLAVLAALDGPGDSDAFKAANDLAFKTCYKHIKQLLLDKFYQGSTYYTQNTCGAFKKKRALSKFQKAYCKDKAK